MNKVFYKIYLESIVIVAIIAGASFCAELLLPDVVSLSQKTLPLLVLFILMVLIARYLSCTYKPTKNLRKNNQAIIFLVAGLLALPPLFIATRNFSPFIQIILIALTLTLGYLLLKPDDQ